MKVDKGLVIKASQGDKDAFSKIYYSCYRDFYNFAFCNFHNADDAADVVSDAFVEIWRGIKNLKSPESFGAWAFKILSARCKKQISAKILQRCEYAFDDAAEDFYFGVKNMEEDVAEKVTLGAALCRLEKEERTIVVLSALYGYTHREIADIIGKPAGTVSSKLYRAYAKLRKLMKEK